MVREFTFEEICEIEPQVSDLLLAARENKLQVDQKYYWDNFLKPQIDLLVGPISRNPRLRSDEVYRVVAHRIAGAIGFQAH